MAGKAVYQMEDKTEYFPTPEWIKDRLYMFIPENSVLVDPCCGAGELEDNNKNVRVYCQDLVKRTDKYDVQIKDFLTEGIDKNLKFDGIIMNPPFGLVEKFVNKAFEYTNTIYIIAPIRGMFNKFGNYITEYSGSWEMTRDFNILVSVACFHLRKNKSFLTPPKNAEKKFLINRLPKTKMLDSLFTLTDTLIPDKPFICCRITKARIIRGEKLIKDEDIFEANDDSAFISQTANINTKKGDRIKRFIKYFDTMKDAKDFQMLINYDEGYIRKYCYEYGNVVLYPKYIPLPQKLQ